MNGLGSYPLNSIWNYSGFNIYTGIIQSGDVDAAEQTTFSSWFFGQQEQQQVPLDTNKFFIFFFG